jgi:hypothetical protein
MGKEAPLCLQQILASVEVLDFLQQYWKLPPDDEQEHNHASETISTSQESGLGFHHCQVSSSLDDYL